MGKIMKEGKQYGVGIGDKKATIYKVPSSSYASFVSVDADDATMILAKTGNLVIVSIVGIATVTTSKSGWTTIVTFPEGYRPIGPVRTVLIDDNSFDATTSYVRGVEVNVRANGNLQVFAPKQGMKLWGGTIVYFTE